MKTKETSTREQALAWWDNLPTWWGNPSKEYYIGLYYSDDKVTPERIEEIWKKEIEEVFTDLKPNQKQFKQFDESLFKAYIDKFSDQDLHRALILIGEKLCKTGYIKDFSYSQKK